MKHSIYLGILLLVAYGNELPGQSFITAEIIEVFCDANGTPDDQSDDILTFGIQVEGTNVSDSCFIELDPGTTFLQILGYGTPVYLEMQPGSAGGGDVVITLTDQLDPNIFTTLTLIDPGFCSFEFPELQAQMLSIDCLDNETPGNSNDDIIQFTIQVTEPFPSYGFDIIPDVGYLDPFIGFYNEPQVFTFEAGSAGGGDRSVMLMDIDDPGYMTNISIPDPGACSTVGASELLSGEEFQLYPNPAGEELFVRLDLENKNGSYFLKMYMPTGQLVGMWEASQTGEWVIPDVGYSGLYFLTLTDQFTGEIAGIHQVVWE